MLALAGGCATTDETDGAKQARACPAGRALICTQRMGKQETCVCEREEKLEDIFESSTGR